MNGTKLIELLRAFTVKERKSLRNFINSPYFNSDETIRFFFDVVIENFSAIEKEKIDKEKIYVKLFPQKKYNDLELRHLSSRLYLLCIKFVSVELAGKKEAARNTELLPELRKRGLEKEFLSLFQKTKTEIEERKAKNRNDYYCEYLINSEYNLFIEGQHKREQEPNLQKVSDSLDTFYLAEKLKLYCQVLSYKTIINYNYEIGLINEIISFLENKKFTDVPLIYSYYKAALMMLDRSKEEHFFELRSYLEKNFQLLAEDELENLLVLSKNYCIRKLNSGEILFVKELFQLYKLEFENLKPAIDYSLSPLTYKNVVAVGLRLGEFNWINNFIEEFKQFLPAIHAEAVYHYNLAKYHFAKKDFLKVTGLLTKVDPSDIFLRIDSKMLLIKTYYEKNEQMAILPLIVTVRSFIRRKTLLSYHKNSYLNFLFFIEKLIDKEELSESKLEALKKEMQNEKELADKEWLLEKIV